MDWLTRYGAVTSSKKLNVYWISTSSQHICGMPALSGTHLLNVKYPSLFILPQISLLTGGTLTTIGIAAYASISKLPPVRILRRAGMVLLTLLVVQEFRLEMKLIEDFTPYTGGKLFRDAIHFLHAQSKQEIAPCFQLFHGFGASSLSFLPVINHFNSSAHIVAADLVGFGFNRRAKVSEFSQVAFSPRWNAALSNDIVEKSNVSYRHSLIVGHSMGAIPAIIASVLKLSATSHINISLILEAPALKLEPSSHSLLTKHVVRKVVDHTIADYNYESPFRSQLLSNLAGVLLLPLQIIREIVFLSLRLLIRRLVFLDSFWSKGLNSVFYDPQRNKIPGPSGYKLPRMAKGFDRQFLNFVLSPARYRYTNQYVANDFGALDLLKALLAEGVRIFIVHGKNDKVVPLSASRNLISELPGVELHEVFECGHIPHEEKPEVFNAILESIISRRGENIIH